MKLTTIFLNLFFIIPLFLGCAEKASENPQLDIIGKWETSDQSLILDINSNKELSSVLNNGKIKIEQNSKFIFVDDTHVYSTWKPNLEVYEIKVYPDHLILKSPEGKTEKLNRIN